MGRSSTRHRREFQGMDSADEIASQHGELAEDFGFRLPPSFISSTFQIHDGFDVNDTVVVPPEYIGKSLLLHVLHEYNNWSCSVTTPGWTNVWTDMTDSYDPNGCVAWKHDVQDTTINIATSGGSYKRTVLMAFDNVSFFGGFEKAVEYRGLNAPIPVATFAGAKMWVTAYHSKETISPPLSGGNWPTDFDQHREQYTDGVNRRMVHAMKTLGVNDNSPSGNVWNLHLSQDMGVFVFGVK